MSVVYLRRLDVVLPVHEQLREVDAAEPAVVEEAHVVLSGGHEHVERLGGALALDVGGAGLVEELHEHV